MVLISLGFKDYTGVQVPGVVIDVKAMTDRIVTVDGVGWGVGRGRQIQLSFIITPLSYHYPRVHRL